MSTSNAIKNRYDFVMLFDVTNGNPNGDPDTDNMPRIDPYTDIGLVSDACIKRKIRNYVDTMKEGEKGYKIYIRKNCPLETSDKEALAYYGIEDMKGAKKQDKDIELKIRNFMCENYFDIRTFGAVMTTFTRGGLNCGQVRGPVQIGFAQSVDPITTQEITLTRQVITTEKDAQEKNNEFGHKYIVPYGLYKAEGYISANLAQTITGFSEDDLELLWKAIINMFEDDRAAARGSMVLRELIVFRHESKHGNAPAHKLFERIKINKKASVENPRKYSDYKVTVDTENLPQGVSCERKI